MEFEPGTKVTVIDEDLNGEVIRTKGDWVWFICEDGFEYKYPKSSLYSISDKGEMNFNPKSYIVDKEAEGDQSKGKGLRINFKGKKPEFDLHLEALFPDRAPQRNKESLLIQLEYASKVIHKAIEVRVRNIVFIHGMGQGILREELRNMLSERFPNVEYFDADYIRYGQGATEVIIHGLGSI
ncbi:MAG: hypothetical protein CMP59_06105 [Flavobacteriales bacterium]|nr:hypothetical protein [Flavobacteriales bacterium]|tara:strand:+ start:797 stop:1342 length:546 start_codon:yes stop_codon:yes gene_type:complete